MTSFKPMALFLLLVLAGFFAAGALSQLRTAPHLEISPEFDVGELVHDQELKLAEGFRNGGNGTLHVEPPIPGCNCAKAELDRSSFLPGESGVFRFVLRPANPPGAEYSQSIVVPSNDPLRPRTMLTIRGRMQDALYSQPPVVHAADLKVGTSWRRQFTVECSDAGSHFNITSVESDLPDLSLSTGLDEATGQTRIVIIGQQGASEVGASTGNILVQTDHPRFRELTVPIRLIVDSHFNVSPPSLLFRTRSDDRPQTLTVTAPSPVELALDDDGKSMFEATVESDETQCVWTITVRRKRRNDPAILIRELLLFHVAGVAGETELSIPVMIVPAIAPSVAGVQDPQKE